MLSALWEHPASPASDVHAHLSPATAWSLPTVKTLLSRLVEKRAASAERDGRRFLYSAVVSREDYAGGAARTLTDRLFGGRAAPLVARLAEDEPLSDTDLAELEALVAAMKAKRT